MHIRRPRPQPRRIIREKMASNDSDTIDIGQEEQADSDGEDYFIHLQVQQL